jgi:ribosome-binding protein aMBF1 (putative translation factor)
MECSECASTAEVTVAKRREAEQDALTAWQEENPLRRWRLKQPPEGWKRSVLARQLEVSHTAVAAWESGKRLPVVDTFAKIEELTGISAKEWMAWYNRKPKQG